MFVGTWWQQCRAGRPTPYTLNHPCVCRDMAAAAWQAAARASDWPRLSAERPRLPDAAFTGLLLGTPLAAAARRCYSEQPGDRALCPDGRCVEVKYDRV